MAWTTVLDATDVTSLASQISWTRKHNRPSLVKCRIPGHLTPAFNVGQSRLKLYESGSLKFHGVVWRVDDQGAENDTWTELTAYDPMIYWDKKPVRGARAASGVYNTGIIFPDLDDPMGETIFEVMTFSTTIWREIYLNSVEHDGPMGIILGSTASGTTVKGRPVDWPMTMNDARVLLVNTGKLDIVMVPTESGGNMAVMNMYNGDYGGASGATFQFGMGANNIKKITRVQDMTDVANTIRYLFGPKCDSQHFCGGSTDRTDGGGGHADAPANDAALQALIDSSVSAYGTLRDHRILDAYMNPEQPCGACDEIVPGANYDLRKLWWQNWKNETLLRCVPRTLVHITPVKGISPTFDTGDLITMQAGAALRGGFSGTQRVYEFTVNVDTEGVAELTQLVTSADQE